MTEQKKPRRKMHTYTLTALLAIFVGAVILAVISRLLPGRISALIRSAMGDEAKKG